ncbi:hypothetical protein [Quadrisphaera sp. KR29]|uniref:hypothetical protein n=1 Tax=Quadrisphaera sp. KR29 TaxID=3461391 RepID=UPI004044A4A5
MRRPTPLRRLSGRPHPEGEEGIALITVVGTMGVVTALVLAALFLVVSSTPRARAGQDASTALGAAQAGVDEYISRLNANDSYWTAGNVDAANAALTTPAAFATAPGRPLPGSTTGARFKYTVLNSIPDIASSGLIQLKVAGTAVQPGGTPTSRTLIATLKIKGFLNYIYFSDVEATDPELWSANAPARYNGQAQVTVGTTTYTFRADKAKVQADCSAKYYEGRQSKSYEVSSATKTTVVQGTNGAVVGTLPGWNGWTTGTVSGYCSRDIQFTTGDVINGPLHSNDLLKIAGSPVFGNPDTSVWSGAYPATGPLYWGGGAPSAGTTAQAGYPVLASKQPTTMPTGNTELLRYVSPKIDTSSNTDRRGCLYRGATKITFTGTTMTVLSPNTTDASTPSRCLDVANRNQPQTKPIPPVIYVAAATGSCKGVGYPLANEATTGLTTNYDCKRGTPFVSGTVDAAVTVAGADDVVVTGDLTYADGGAGTDVLGLVATGYVWVHHPVSKTSPVTNLTAADGYTPVHTIQAGILSLKHSFLVQNYDKGAALSTGTAATKLNVLGAIAQMYRGPVGTGNGTTASTGYLKNYVYDTRFNALQPPYFIKPVSSPWQVQSVVDAPAGS